MAYHNNTPERVLNAPQQGASVLCTCGEEWTLHLTKKGKVKVAFANDPKHQQTYARPHSRKERRAMMRATYGRDKGPKVGPSINLSHAKKMPPSILVPVRMGRGARRRLERGHG